MTPLAATEPLTLFGIRVVGINSENEHKLPMMLVFLIAVFVLGFGRRALLAAVLGGDPESR